MRKIGITETVLRDAQQSLIATRMPYSDLVGILKNLDDAGYHSLECWGGATFDACLRYLNEDPWERLRLIKSNVKKTKLQMLLRGQNLLGYKHYSDDVVRMFVAKSIENGIDILRIFDALNDFRNIEVAIDETIKCGGHAQGTICFTLSQIHNTAMYAQMGKDLENMGVHSICIKDMAGIMGPQDAFELVSTLKSTVKLPIIVHTHSTTGLAALTYLKSVEAGCDVIDTAISSMSGGTSQPATETLMYGLRQLGYTVDLNDKKIQEINDFFKPLKAKYLKDGLLDPFVMGTETDALVYQVPGGMLSNLIAQLKHQNAINKLDEVLAEVPKVRKELGYPPLVTPISQMVGVQAANNVLSGERYKNISKEIKSYLKGEYGQAPGEVDKTLQSKVLNGDSPITERYADLLTPIFDTAKSEIGQLAKSDEDVLSYIMFPQIAKNFLESKEKRKQNKVTYFIKKKQ